MRSGRGGWGGGLPTCATPAQLVWAPAPMSQPSCASRRCFSGWMCFVFSGWVQSTHALVAAGFLRGQRRLHIPDH